MATIVIGFYWGGWTLGSTAAKQVKDAEQASVVRVLAPICADKIPAVCRRQRKSAGTQEGGFMETQEIVEKAGWTTFPGSEPDRAVAEACVNLLNVAK